MPVSKTQELLSNEPQDIFGWIQLGPAIEPSKNFVENKIGDEDCYALKAPACSSFINNSVNLTLVGLRGSQL